ncbi:NAD-dependent epimerase/dehydratase family protein [Robiginitalea sediminis]|uniref:NAD-dependent epimerase/dehydratase family protein n=1 Tax=Robiginitalea sediminis TaxID=1982593 RepID=UPI000B4B1EBC|nr:NAD-dependent epimerase/dehydratase family protein [Robiginitalea sediminis]
MELVTGATGLLGSHLTLELLRSGATVRAVYRHDGRREQTVQRWLDANPANAALLSRLEWVHGDILDLPFLETALTGIQTVFHCAALVSFDPSQEAALLKTNWEGTRNMVNTALYAKVEAFCHVSSIATVDGTAEVLTESDTWDPARTNGYATSKYLGEMEVWRGSQEGLQTLIVNPGVIFGPGNWDEGSGRFFSRVAGGLRYYPPGGTGFIGLDDTVRCILALVQKKMYRQRFLLVSENLSYRSVLVTIARNLGVRPPSRPLHRWHLELLWRLDWARHRLTGSPRQLSRGMARHMGGPGRYGNKKVREALGYSFQPMEEVIAACATAFKKDRPVG